MTVESATYIGQLDPTKPAGSDGKAEGDDMIRLLKSVLQAQFTSLGNAAVTVTAAQLNSVTAKGAIAGQAWTGSHDFTGATITAATKTAGNNTTEAATTAFVTNAVTSVNASGATTMVVETGTTNTAVAGQHIVITNVGTTTVTLPASPAAGNEVRITVANGLLTNVIDPGAEKLMGSTDDMTINHAYATVWVRYVNATLGWRIV
jgi:hypothetical protein